MTDFSIGMETGCKFLGSHLVTDIAQPALQRCAEHTCPRDGTMEEQECRAVVLLKEADAAAVQFDEHAVAKLTG